MNIINSHMMHIAKLCKNAYTMIHTSGSLSVEYCRLMQTMRIAPYTVSNRTLACINYVLNQGEGVVRAGQPGYQFIP